MNLYQLRLPARDLVQRDALVLRIGSETSVDAVVVEESAPEKGEETEAARGPWTSRTATPTSGRPIVSWTR